MDTNKAAEKIRHLLNKTIENGCTEDEAETALRMAASMAAKYGIDLDACRPKGTAKILYKHGPSKLKPHQGICARAAAELFGVECNLYNLGYEGLSFVGRDELVELVEETMFWLFRQVEELYKQALPKRLTRKERSEFRKTFKAACALRVYERVVKLIREMRTNEGAARKATGHNALVVQGYYKTLQEEIASFWDEQYKLTPEQEARIAERKKREQERRAELTQAQRDAEDRALAKAAEKIAARKPRKGRSIPTGRGTDAGYAAGNRVQLRKEVQ